MSEYITLEVGGKTFKTKKLTLDRIPDSQLARLDTAVDRYEFDRDPYLFRHILNAHRDRVVHVPRDVCPVVFKEELLYWNIPLALVKPCCWKYLYEPDGEIETIKLLIENENEFDTNYADDKSRSSIKQTVFSSPESAGSRNEVCLDEKNKGSYVWSILDEPGSSKGAKVWCFLYISVVITSVIVYAIWVEPAVRVPRYLYHGDNELDIFANDTVYEDLASLYPLKAIYMVASDPHPVLFAADMFCTLFFTVETVVHFSACPKKSMYIKNSYHVIKLVLCVAMIVSTAFEIRKDLYLTNYAVGYFNLVCKSVNVLRLLLIFRLHKIYNRLHIMILSLRYSCKELGLLLFCFFIAVVIYGSLIFSAEIDTDMFSSTLISMWWSLVTMTTIGYGDLYPTKWSGYLVGVACAVNGIIVLALPIAAIAGTFSCMFARNSDLQRHKLMVKSQTGSAMSKKSPDS